jgi:hypothetical protein
MKNPPVSADVLLGREDGGCMDTALQCAQCGTPVRGSRFCTSCGTPLSIFTPDEAGAAAEVTAEVPTDGQYQSHEPGRTAFLPTGLLGPGQAADGESAPPWVSGQPVPPSKARPNVVAIIVVAALAFSGWAIWRGVEEHTLTGTVLLADTVYFGVAPGRPCSGERGYDDVDAGAQVVLTDDEGTTVSTGRLSEGEFDGLGCVFSFALEDVPRSEFYGLSIASDSRGHLQYSYDELADSDWSVQLSLGED